MKPDDKWLIAAERFDSWRVFPRALILSYCLAWYHLMERLQQWYTHLPAAEQTAVNAGLFSVIGAVLTGFGVPLYKIYSDAGRDWNAKPDAP
jgi:hypothetical protein